MSTIVGASFEEVSFARKVMKLTLTQNIFACCLCLFGPGFAFWGAYLCRHTRLGSLWGFLLAGFFAYAGWFISGLVALNLYPDYAYGDPPETTAALFTIPGFVTGLVGLFVLRRVAGFQGNKEAP